jgi:hypothetical protein
MQGLSPIGTNNEPRGNRYGTVNTKQMFKRTSARVYSKHSTNTGE